MGVGNLIFVDDNGNKRFDLGEGRDEVTVELYHWGDRPGEDQPVAVTNTADGGVYQFNSLWDGSYFVHIPASQFLTDGNLRGMFSLPGFSVSDDEAGEDSIDSDQPWLTGIGTRQINLVSGDAPTNNGIETGYGSSTDDSNDGNVDLTVDLGLFRPVAVGNLVFADHNYNGHYDSGEGMEGVRVELYSDLHYPGVDSPLAHTTTDAAGRYVFNQLLTGNYFIHIPASQFQQNQPLHLYLSIIEGLSGDDDVGEDGINIGDPSDSGVSSLVLSLYPAALATSQTGESGFEAERDDQNDASSDLTVDFGFYRPLGLGNLVYVDSNGNGKADLGEGLDGVTVELYRADQTPGLVLPIFTQVTADGGRYFFNILPPGEYRVHVPNIMFEPSRPLHGLFSITGTSSNSSSIDDDLPGNDNGLDGDYPMIDGVSSEIVSLQNDTEPEGNSGEEGVGRDMDAYDDDNFDLTIDFGFARRLTVGIGNLVWRDLNGSGSYDEGEGLDGVAVQLFQEGADPLNSDPIAQTVTSGGGVYFFANLQQGSFKVFIPPSQFAAGKPLWGLSSIPGDGADNQIDDNIPGGGDNGIDGPDPESFGVVSTAIELLLGKEPVNSLAETGAFAWKDDFTDANADLTVDFGFYRAVGVGNVVFEDANQNGSFDTGEGVADPVFLELYKSTAAAPFDAPVATTVTGPDGSYLFSGLNPDSYYIRVAPVNFEFGMPLYKRTSVSGVHSGDDNLGEDGIDNGNPLSNGIVSGIFTLSPSGSPTGSDESGFQAGSDDLQDADVNLTIDFGFVRAIGVGNLVFYDSNNDGIFDPVTERGLDGVTVELWSTSGNTTERIGATTTYGGGLYNFNAAPGSYHVVIPPSNFSTGGALNSLLPSGHLANSLNITTTNGDDDVMQDGYTTSSVLIEGARTALFDLQHDKAPTAATTETGLYSDSDDLDDANVDLTIDLGFAPAPLRVGNLVFRDVNANRHYDGEDFGVAGVKVRLYKIGDDPADANTAPVMESTTAIDGSFSLSAYSAGQYFLHIPASQFADGAALFGTTSVPGFGDDDGTDDSADENGLDTASPSGTGVSSIVFELAYGTEPLGTTGESGFLATQDEANDDDADLTIDFGFVASAGQPMSAQELRVFSELDSKSASPATFTAWQAQNSLEGLSQPNDDPDSDGLTNLLEYALGSQPDSGLGDARFALEQTGGGTIDAWFTRPMGGQRDLRYVVECSSDLTTWLALPIVPVIKPNADRTETLRFEKVESAFGAHGQGFLRLKVCLDADLDGFPEASAVTPASAWSQRQLPLGTQSFAMPLMRPSIYTGRVSAVNAHEATINTNGHDIQTQFQGRDCYYAEVLDGVLAGHTFEIDSAASFGGTLVLATPAGPGLVGSRIRVRPHWSLESLFKASVFHPADRLDTADRILFFDHKASRFEINWLYSSGMAMKWVCADDSLLTDNGPRIIPPQAGMMVQIRTTPVTLTSVGEIRAAPLALPVTSGKYFVGTGLAVPLSPGSQPHSVGSSLRIWRGDFDSASASYQTYFLDSNSRWIEESTGFECSNKPVLEGYRAFFLVKP